MALFGGNWNNGSNAGVFNVNLNNARSNSNNNIGLRPALPHLRPKPGTYGCLASAVGGNGVLLLAEPPGGQAKHMNCWEGG